MNKAEKSLRWVVNQIPDFTPKNNEEKMLVAIKLYSEAGAEEIKRLEAENAELKEKAQKLDEQLKAISDRTAKFSSLEQIEKRFLDWAIPFLKARITGCKEEWFGIEWIAKAIWEFIKGGFETAIAVDETNAALRERLGKWIVDNEIVMEPRVKDGQTYYVISRKERRIVTHYICTELTPEAAEARLIELQGEKQ